MRVRCNRAACGYRASLRVRRKLARCSDVTRTGIQLALSHAASVPILLDGAHNQLDTSLSVVAARVIGNVGVLRFRRDSSTFVEPQLGNFAADVEGG